MKSSRWVTMSSTCIALAFVTLPAQAQAPAQTHNPVAAQALFDQGKALMAQANYAEACPKFVESERLDPGVGTLLNLAVCYEESGRTASAWSIFLEGESAARTAGNAEAARVARSRADALAPKLPKVRINIANPNLPGLEVRRDNDLVGPAQWGVPIPADPGIHHIRASAPGYRPRGADVEVKASASTIDVSIPDLDVDTSSSAAATPAPLLAAPPGSAPLVPAPPASSVAPADNGAGVKRAVGYVLGGIGIVGLGLGTVFNFIARSENDKALGYCTAGPAGTACVDDTELSNHDKHLTAAKSDRNVSYAAFGVGLAALGTGIVLVVLARPQASETTASIAPLLDARTVGLSYARSW